jgi:hypothetical protein
MRGTHEHVPCVFVPAKAGGALQQRSWSPSDFRNARRVGGTLAITLQLKPLRKRHPGDNATTGTKVTG